MQEFQSAGAYRATRTPTGALVLAPAGSRVATCYVFGLHAGALPPESLHDPRLESIGEGDRWLLACREGNFEFNARGLEVQQPLPGLFDAMLAGFALRPRERRVVRWLLRLIRLPGGARLLRAWHGRRGR